MGAIFRAFLKQTIVAEWDTLFECLTDLMDELIYIHIYQKPFKFEFKKSA